MFGSCSNLKLSVDKPKGFRHMLPSSFNLPKNKRKIIQTTNGNIKYFEARIYILLRYFGMNSLLANNLPNNLPLKTRQIFYCCIVGWVEIVTELVSLSHRRIGIFIVSGSWKCHVKVKVNELTAGWEERKYINGACRFLSLSVIRRKKIIYRSVPHLKYC